MPRIRTIKPEMFMSPQIMNLSHSARLLFIGLISQADDEGRGIADPRKLKAVIFGGDDDVTTTRLGELLGEIEGQKLCVTYETEAHGRVYSIPTWRNHQYVEKPKKSVYPPPITLESPQPPVSVGESLGIDPHGSDLKDRNGPERISSRARAGGESPRRANGIKKTPAELASDARTLMAAGTNPGDIVKLLSGYGVTADQVREWTSS